MNFSLFYHSLVSDWNHGNAHFLRGVVAELQNRGHRVRVFEPARGWSRENLIREQGIIAVEEFHLRYPQQMSILYDRNTLDLEKVATESDVILVHEWNEPWLVNGLGELHNVQPFSLLFHDTHHRSVSDPAWLRRFRLDFYDGILAFGNVLSEVYRKHGWSDSVWTWHEAADIKRFFPHEPNLEYPSGDLVWIGNWGDEERSRELDQFLFKPIRALGLDCHLYGVRYPKDVLQFLDNEGVHYCGWLPNFRVPEVFANHAVTVHVPRRYYAETLPGIPTIRPFEAMACGIPLVSAPWQDSEKLFQPGKDYLVARDTEEMQNHLHTLLHEPDFARHLAAHGLATIRASHTCAHRVDQLLQIIVGIDSQGATGNRERDTSTACSGDSVHHNSTRRSNHGNG